MHIEDVGIVVGKTKWSETSAIVSIFSRDNGLIKSLVKGGLQGRKKLALEVSNFVKFKKVCKSVDQLGVADVELLKSNFAGVASSNVRLLMLQVICNLLMEYMPDRVRCSNFYSDTVEVVDCICDEVSLVKTKHAYIKWELSLLGVIGYGLDLTRCAVTSSVLDLKYISPKTGRAVCLLAGEPYKDRLLPFPNLMLNFNSISLDGVDGVCYDYNECFYVISYFFNKYNFEYNKKLPLLRAELIKLF